MTQSWCVLRVAGRHTLRLAESLAADGYAVWTPIETRRIRIPRANVRREVTLPIMPSYIFARSHQLIDLLQLAAMQVKPRRGKGWGQPAHADFSIMRDGERIPLIADVHLTGLRVLEAKRTPRRKAQVRYPQGLEVRVKIEGGSFAGMSGRVDRSDFGHTMVCFDDRMTVKISTSLLEPNELWAAESHVAKAA